MARTTDYETLKKPVYKILAEHGFFGPDCKLWKEGEVIIYTDEPNLEMKPMNAAARDAMDKYVSKMTEFARAKAEKDGKPFSGLPVDMISALDDAVESAYADNRKIAGFDEVGNGKVPMRNRLKASDPRIAAVVSVDPAKELEVVTLKLGKGNAA